MAKIYIRSQDGMSEWQQTDKGYVLTKKSTFDTRALALDFRRPQEAGVSPGGNEWVVFSAGFDIPRFIWVDVRRDSTGVFNFPTAGARMIGIDQAGRMYMCSGPIDSASFCRAFNVSTGNVEWEYKLPVRAGLVGGAIVPDRLYVAVSNYIYAIDGQAGQAIAAGSTTPTPTPTETPVALAAGGTPTAAYICGKAACRYPGANAASKGSTIFLPVVVSQPETSLAPEPTPVPYP